jgi:lipopolysaccharide/colanic/teichoic acid biosynthesis glycosyltransferase
MLKRICDILNTSIGLILLSPVFFALSLAIKLNDKGPVLYKGTRAGKGGAPFKMYKFRTMVMNADKIGGPSTSGDDPRLTKIGVFLRKYKLDELPQLLNVLKGDMSLVGPRPEVLSEIQATPEKYRKILSVTPGITDYASLAFPNEGEILKGATDPHQAYKEKIQPKKMRLQEKYVDERSFWTDCTILLSTLREIASPLRSSK